jgi:hypothetical protein
MEDLPVVSSADSFIYTTQNDPPKTLKSFPQGGRSFMLELRPTCEHCNKALPPASLEARICSYECTFCAACVDDVLGNVCPNCGGGFVPRPIRPSRNWKGENFLGKDPASTKVKHRPVDLAAHAELSASIGGRPPEQR